jgi:hypothetical protein
MHNHPHEPGDFMNHLPPACAHIGALAFLAIALTLFSAPAQAQSPVSPPPPFGPVPSPRQLAWQRDELLMFEHFGLHSFAINGQVSLVVGQGSVNSSRSVW